VRKDKDIRDSNHQAQLEDILLIFILLFVDLVEKLISSTFDEGCRSLMCRRGLFGYQVNV